MANHGRKMMAWIRILLEADTEDGEEEVVEIVEIVAIVVDIVDFFTGENCMPGTFD